MRSDGAQAGDDGLLARLRELFGAADPVPDGLVERIRFSVALASMEAELAQLTDAEQELVRGTPEESRTITFDSSSLTIMIRIDSNADGSARVDGWLAPPQPRQVEITLADGSVTADADDQGRFAFASVPRGTARLVVRPPQPGSGRSSPGPFGMNTVITPTLVLLVSA